ncbi:MAG: leucine-rich repeat domain-containing protein [Clostridia bacterium]
MRFREKEGKGITLIALVITIIVLLILAGVTILALTGENGILTQANNAKEQNNRAQSEEEVKLAIANLKIEESQKDMNQEEKANVLKKELQRLYPEQKTESTVSIIGTGFLINHRGCEFEIDKDYNVFYKEPFDAEEWDAHAASEDCFIWLSDDKTSEDYGTIIGYTSNATNNTTLRYPSRCTKVEFTYNEERYNGVGYDSARAFVRNIKEVELPRTVVNIGDYAFSGDSWHSFQALEKINIPNSVMNIGSGAFYGCTNLSNITLSSRVTNIGNGAFSGCTSLSSITIPNGVTTIGSGAFSGCKGLGNIAISDGVINIESRAFYGCTSLEDIEIPDSVRSVGAESFDNTAWYNNQPEGVVYVGKIAYKYKGTMPSNTNIEIIEGTKIIAEGAFKNCTNLDTIIIPNTVTTVGKYAFYYCTNLNNITLPNSITNVESNAFQYCKSLSDIKIPDSVTNIGSYAFNGCTSLENITISNNLKTIESRVFWGCSKLASIVLPDSITSIGESAFWSCRSLKSINIPDNVTDIGDGAFDECVSLESIIIPKSVISIGRIAFIECTNLRNIEVDANNPNYTSENGVLFNKDKTTLIFCNNGINEIIIPNSVKTIQERAFAYCTNLNSVTIPNSVTSIGSACFSGCTSLSSIIIPDSVTTIESEAFSRCTSLNSIIIPTSVTNIGSIAFASWTAEQTIYCRTSEKLSGWSNTWSYYGWTTKTKANVVWGYTGN